MTDLLLAFHPHPILGLLVFLLYFLPASIAVLRGHPQVVPICILDFFLGWTVIGWLVALFWATRSFPAAQPAKQKRRR